MENIAINKSFKICILTASRLYAVWRPFCGIPACPLLKFRCIRGRHIFLYQRVYDHVHHRKKHKIFLTETSDPNSAAVLSDDTCDLSVAVIVSIHVPADQTQSFAPGQEPAVCSF